MSSRGRHGARLFRPWLQAAKALTHRLAGHAAKMKLDPTLRQTFAQAGAAIGADLKMLRTQVRCPPS